MPEQDQAHRHGHPGQAEPRSHGETHHEMRRINLNTADRREIEDLPMGDLSERKGCYGLAPSRAGRM